MNVCVKPGFKGNACKVGWEAVTVPGGCWRSSDSCMGTVMRTEPSTTVNVFTMGHEAAKWQLLRYDDFWCSLKNK